MIEVNIGDQRDRHRRFDLRKDLGRFLVRNGHSDDFAAGSFKLLNLCDRRDHIACVRRTHRLHGHRGITPNLHLADRNLSSFSPGYMHLT